MAADSVATIDLFESLIVEKGEQALGSADELVQVKPRCGEELRAVRLSST